MMERISETWPIERFRPNPKNARIHSPEQIEQIRGSLREFGWTYPVLVDENDVVIAGHGRLAAAKLQGFSEAPALIARGWTEKQKRAYALADNRIAESASWDANILREEFGWLQDQGFDIALTGFSLAELSDPGILAGGIGAGLGSGGGSSANAKPPGSLSEKFFAVPFSVLNAREGWWQRRKALWLALGIQSELGRGENLIKRSLESRLEQAIPGHYSNTKAFIDECRGTGMNDEQIEEEAAKRFGHKKESAGDFSRVGAVIPVGGDVKQILLDKRAEQKAARLAKEAQDGL